MQLSKIHTCTGHRAAVYALCPGKKPGQFLSGGGEGWIVEWDLNNPDEGRVSATITNRVFCMVPIWDRNWIVAGNMDGGIHWVDLKNPDNTKNIDHHKKGLFSVLQVGAYLYSAGGDGILTRWSIEERRSLESIRLSQVSLRSLAYSPDLNEIAVGASDFNIFRLDADTFELKDTIRGAHTNSVFTVQYHPENNQLLSGGRDAMLRIWDLDNGNALINEQPAHMFTINHIAFSPDGKYFATASRDKTFKVWDSSNFQLLKVIETIRDSGHINSVNRLLWMEDTLISSGDDRSIILWKVS